MNEIDKIFKSKLEHHTTSYPDDMWDKISTQLAKDQSLSKRIPWFWISGAAILLMLLGFYLWKSSSQNAKSDTLPNSTVTLLENRDANKIDNNEAILADESTVANISMKANQTEVQSDPSSSSSFITENTSTSVDAVHVNQKNNSNNSNSKINTKSKISYITTSNSTAIANTISRKSTDLLDKQNPSNSNFNNAFSNSENDVASPLNDNFEHELIEVDIVNLDNFNASLRNSFNIRPIRTIGISQYSKSLKSLFEMEEISLSDRMLEEFRQDCPSFVTDRTGVYFDLYWSHEYALSSLSAKSAELDAFRDLRNETESSTYSYSIGARLTLMLPNGLGLKTGLNYSQINETFNYVDTESQMTRQIIVIDTLNGIEYRDTSYIVVPGTRDVNVVNKYRSVDIPLLLSYEWDIADRTYMTINGGIYLNLLFKESGKVLDIGGEVISLDNSGGDNLSIYKNNIGLSLFASTGLHYRWIKNVDLILEPNFRLLVKSATVDGYPLNHKWMTVGLITGMRYNF